MKMGLAEVASHTQLDGRDAYNPFPPSKDPAKPYLPFS
jgi:hypothetical protein